MLLYRRTDDDHSSDLDRFAGQRVSSRRIDQPACANRLLAEESQDVDGPSVIHVLVEPVVEIGWSHPTLLDHRSAAKPLGKLDILRSTGDAVDGGSCSCDEQGGYRVNPGEALSIVDHARGQIVGSAPCLRHIKSPIDANQTEITSAATSARMASADWADSARTTGIAR